MLYPWAALEYNLESWRSCKDVSDKICLSPVKINPIALIIIQKSFAIT
jgi:hypothetical protein